MRSLKRFVTLLLTVFLLLATVAPALAATNLAGEKAQVVFQNKTGGTVRITLTGPTTVTLNLSTGKTLADLQVGAYKYSYAACEKTNTGTFRVRASGDTLTLPKCTGGGGGGGSSTTQLVIQNKTDGTLYFVFTGPKTYYVTAPAGSKTKVEMLEGKYTYTVRGTACGFYSEQDGKVTVKGNRTWTWFCP